MRTAVVLDAPSNLGLRPPAPGTVPGCHKPAGALRDRGIVRRLGARDTGVVNAAALAAYPVKPADRVERHVRAGEFPVVLGGDCSIRRPGRGRLCAILTGASPGRLAPRRVPW